MRGFEPMLAHNEPWAFSDLDWSLEWQASAKYDGYRAVTLPRRGGLSRNLKPFPNLDVADFLRRLPPYLDGELVVGEPTAKGCFQRTSSLVTTKGRAGLDGLRFWVFDTFEDPAAPYARRLAALRRMRLGRLMGVEMVEAAKVLSADEAAAHKATCVALGYEGSMLRRGDGRYKFGRSTFAEGLLLKSKVTLQGEAKIIGVFSRKRNANPQERDALGRARRSKRKEGMVELQELGGFVCRDVKTGVVFECGPGVLTAAQRRMLWDTRARLGRRGAYEFLTYLSDPTTDTMPRFPRFHGFRGKADF